MKSNRKHKSKSIIKTLSIFCVVLFVLYLVSVLLTVASVVSTKHAEAQIKEATSELATLESDFYTMKVLDDTTIASEYGFVETATHFILIDTSVAANW